MVTVEQIDQWRLVPTEYPNLEFKQAKSGFSSDRLCEYCVAIANEGGGHLVLGLSDEPPRDVVGSSAFLNPSKTAKLVFDRARLHVDVRVVDHPDGRVVAIEIPSRPRGTAYSLDGRFLARSGESLVSMSEDRLRSIMTEGNPDWLDEPAATGMTKQAVIESLDTQTFFELLEEPFPTNTSAILDRLSRERIIEARAGLYDLSRLGAILLARRLSDFQGMGRKAPRLIVYSGSSKLQTRIDQVGTKGYAVGFRGLVQSVMAQLPQNEIVQDAVREKTKLLPESAIRELVANALIHQDFSIGGASVMIELYTDRIEISNPGEPVVPTDRFIDGYQSRNERLADLMRRMRICEEKGSGIDRVVNAAEVYQLPPPDFRDAYCRTASILAGPKTFDAMDRNERMRACYQHACLKRVTNDFMTNQTLRMRFKLSDSKAAIVSQVISATLEAQLIKIDESVGKSTKLRRYLPCWA